MKTNIDIQDTKTYNVRMERSMIDKLFFVDKIDADVIVDYGCADGTMLGHARQWMPDLKMVVGFDNNQEMLDRAKKKIGGFLLDNDRLALLGCPLHELIEEAKGKQLVALMSQWIQVTALLEDYRGISYTETEPAKYALILNSVIHEVLHYSSPEVVAEFWQRVFHSGFRYIVIRDMIPSRSVDRPSDTNDVAKVYNKFGGEQVLRDFERQWGSIENNKNLVHFLLKYKYLQPNWEREVRENYLPLYREELLAMIPTAYQVIYHEHFVLPWIARQVRNDMGLWMHDNTHIKIIMELI